MGRGLHQLSARTVATITTPGRYADGGGLYLFVRQRGQSIERLWVFRYKRGSGGKIKEKVLSLGPARDVSLADARSLAQQCRTALQLGKDPAAAIKRTAEVPTFGQVADEVVEKVIQGFKRGDDGNTAACWRRTLGDTYCGKLRKRPVDLVDTEDVLETVKPVWQEKQETGLRLRRRIELVLDTAAVKGHRTGANPARWKGHLKFLLPEPKKLTRGHHKALPYQELPEFLHEVRKSSSVSARALEWTILTVARTIETIGTPRKGEIDRSTQVWIVPADRMKESVEHRVPLTNRCMEILKELEQLDCRWIFPSSNGRKHISEAAMAEFLKDIVGTAATVHGFRSSFRTWVQEETNFPDWMAEAALSHQSGDEVERSYKRGDALKKRRVMMEAWEGYCAGGVGNIIKFRAQK